MDLSEIKITNEIEMAQIDLVKKEAKQEMIHAIAYGVIFLLIGIGFMSMVSFLSALAIVLAVIAWLFMGNYCYAAYLANTHGEEKEGLLITNYRLLHYFERRGQIVHIADYHHEFFEKIEILYVQERMKMPNQIYYLIAIIAVGILSYPVLSVLGILEFYLFGAFGYAIYFGIKYYEAYSKITYLPIKVHLTSGRELLYRFPSKMGQTERAQEVAFQLIKASREFICNAKNY